ncbi:MAG: ECF RNA polymerase sigma factor SigW [Firmicutes bacterium ADurb.Bin182]|nr:MAG: ECF RNA polymerase sigma factor SigW [Firmicutes bacterium ADurb.Bin182]
MPERDFEAIYAAYSQMVYWTAYSVSKNHHTALDAVQNVFLRVLKHLSKLQSMTDGQLKGWLYRVTVNQDLDRIRKEKREVLSADPAPNVSVPESDLPEAAAMSREQRETVRNSIEALPEHYRQPVMLYYFAELSYSEISELLGVSEGTLKSRMSRARDILAHSLLKAGDKNG